MQSTERFSERSALLSSYTSRSFPRRDLSFSSLAAFRLTHAYTRDTYPRDLLWQSFSSAPLVQSVWRSHSQLFGMHSPGPHWNSVSPHGFVPSGFRFFIFFFLSFHSIDYTISDFLFSLFFFFSRCARSASREIIRYTSAYIDIGERYSCNFPNRERCPGRTLRRRSQERPGSAFGMSFKLPRARCPFNIYTVCRDYIVYRNIS